MIYLCESRAENEKNVRKALAEFNLQMQQNSD